MKPVTPAAEERCAVCNEPRDDKFMHGQPGPHDPEVCICHDYRPASEPGGVGVLPVGDASDDPAGRAAADFAPEPASEPGMITRNAARCKKCGDTIESKSVHDWVSCKCKAIFVDGGKEYLRSGGDIDALEDLSVTDKKSTLGDVDCGNHSHGHPLHL